MRGVDGVNKTKRNFYNYNNKGYIYIVNFLYYYICAYYEELLYLLI